MQHERLKGEFRESVSRYYSVQNVSLNFLLSTSLDALYFKCMSQARYKNHGSPVSGTRPAPSH